MVEPVPGDRDVAERVVRAAVAAGLAGWLATGLEVSHGTDPSDPYLTSARRIRQIPIANGRTNQMKPLTAR